VSVPRSRASRRRITLATVGLLLVCAFVAFARDVKTAATRSSGPLTNINENFGGIANGLIRSENSLDQQFHFLLTHGATLSRAQLASRLIVMSEEVKAIGVTSRYLIQPTIVGDLNTRLRAITAERTQAWRGIIHNLEADLQLPFTAASNTVNPALVLQSSSTAWNQIRHQLRNEPGRVVLHATTNATDNYLRVAGFSRLTQSVTLRLVRSLTISAVQILPAPLPQVGQILTVPATGQLHCAVVVTNGAYVVQPVIIRITFRDVSGGRAVQTSTLHATLGPSASHAFIPKAFKVSTSERGTLTIALVNAPHLPGAPTTRTYHLLTTPAG